MSRAEHITMEFVNPTFNDLTLNFPEPTPEEVLKAARKIAYDALDEMSAERRVIEKDAARNARRTRQRLESLVRGGWIIEFEPRQHLGLQTSTRGQRRREKLGRA